jgi:hypothetical protein
LVVLQAHSKGTKQASFAVDYDGGSAMIPLTGEGAVATGGDGGSDGHGDTPGGRASYYACSTGHPSALWPVALVLLGLRRRWRAR